MTDISKLVDQQVITEEQPTHKITANILFPRIFVKEPIKRIFEKGILNIIELIPRKRIFAIIKIEE